MTGTPRGAAEFELIERIRARALHRDDVILGIGDDAAIVQVPAGQHLVVATDTLNAGVHFPVDTAPADIGWKALAVNLSDLAAMGAQPAWCTLSLSLPHGDVAWLDAFLDGFLELAAQHRVALVGGDTTRGPLSLCVTVHGFVEPGRALRRDGAQVGDDIWITGTLGDASGALALLHLAPLPFGEAARSDGTPVRVAERPVAMPKGRSEGSGEGLEQHAGDSRGVSRNEINPRAHDLRQRLDRPTPRIATGLALAGIAHSAIDISDGLLADLGHVCRASGVGAQLQLDTLPASPALCAAFAEAQRHALQAGGGDDYELCFSAPVSARAVIGDIASGTATAITRIGCVVAGEDMRVLDREGADWRPPHAGYVHFSGQSRS
ncbi:MAG: thiamine-phosphate kinase [Pseudomonadota bacterium]|nr:thiamine-phosphate kinase [Pseudomonadota bacterium]